MPELIAQGPQPDNRWRRHLKPGIRTAVGRQAGEWSTPWDNLISRQHVEIRYDDGHLYVEKLATAANAVFYKGHDEEKFVLSPGEHFVIGKTTFSLADPRSPSPADLPGPTEQHTFATIDLHQHRFREPDKRIHALSRLPDIIHRASSDQELFERLVKLLLNGIERSTAAAVVAVDRSAEKTMPEAPVSLLHWDRHLLSGPDFRPSHRLIRQAVAGGQSVAYVWNRDAGASQHPSQTAFTLSDQTEWAICTPIASSCCPGWALYVAGGFDNEFSARSADPEQLHDDVKYTEIMAATLGGLLESQQLAARQASLSHFFSPIVLKAITAGDADQVLTPREADITVLFCDLRGFSSESQRSANDLFGLLARVSDALGVTTREILQHGGVIGDFHGDAAMGFWGWPIAQPDSVIRACRAALAIRSNFEQTDSCGSEPAERTARATSKFRVGIGLASGRAVAGKIGTSDQVKVTAFGPVVNLAARLETMTRQIPAAILADEPTATNIKQTVSTDVCRVRRLARIQPVGLTAPINVYEVLPPADQCPHLTDQSLADYDAALTAFESGDWSRALALLNNLPATDRPKSVVLDYIHMHHDRPPPQWDGAIRLTAK